jgi:hypothetical protein
MKASYVMRVNKDAVMSNCISSALWSKRPYATSLRLAAEETASGYGVEKDITFDGALQYFTEEWNKIYNSSDLLNKMITRIRKTYVNPAYTNNAEFVCREFDSDLTTVNELFETLRYVGY